MESRRSEPAPPNYLAVGWRRLRSEGFGGDQEAVAAVVGEGEEA